MSETILKDIVGRHLQQHHCTARTLAEQCRMSYPTALAVVNQGLVPRKPEHREYLRRFLGFEERPWADLLLQASGIEALAADRPTAALQLQVAREMFALGLSEQTLANLAGVPYPSVLNLVRKGTIPRSDALRAIAGALAIDADHLAATAAACRQERRRQDPRHMEVAIDEETPGLAQLVARHIARERTTIGAFAKSTGIGYLTLSRFLTHGRPPGRLEVLRPLRQALGLSHEEFAAALQCGQGRPAPASVSVRVDGIPANANPLQAELIRHMRQHKLTIKCLSQRTGLSQITISRLIKHGALPRRDKTHQAIRGLLRLDEDAYRALLNREFITTTSYRQRSAGSAADDAGRPPATVDPAAVDQDDAYEPDAEAVPHGRDGALDHTGKDDLTALIAQLDAHQRAQIRTSVKRMLDQQKS
jgi:transcriptional regulator with XRE-family HTH domain